LFPNTFSIEEQFEAPIDGPKGNQFAPLDVSGMLHFNGTFAAKNMNLYSLSRKHHVLGARRLQVQQHFALTVVKQIEYACGM